LQVAQKKQRRYYVGPNYFRQVFTGEENVQEFNSPTTTSNGEQMPIKFEVEVVLKQEAKLSLG